MLYHTSSLMFKIKNEIQKNINKNIISLLEESYNHNWDLSKLQELQVLYNYSKAVLKASSVVFILSITLYYIIILEDP